jgi:hypothetical protein
VGWIDLLNENPTRRIPFLLLISAGAAGALPDAARGQTELAASSGFERAKAERAKAGTQRTNNPENATIGTVNLLLVSQRDNAPSTYG